MHQKLLFAFLLLFSLTCFSQDSVFHIKNYKYRTDGYKALALDLNLSGSRSSSETDFSSKSTGKNFQLAPSNIRYSRIISKEARWHQSEISLQPYYVYSKSSSSTYNYEEQRFISQMVWRRTDRFYKNKNQYVEFGNELRGSMVSMNDEWTTSKTKNGENSASDVLTLGVGKGRIEFVQDAQMASFILEDLQRQGLLQGAVDAETYNAFAKLLTDINNRRVFDSRRRRIYELTRIDSFLRNKGLVTTPDIRSFTTINDNWSLAFNPPRSSGTIFFVKLKPSVMWGNDVNKTTELFSYTKATLEKRALGLSPQIGFEKYTPSSLQWQHNLGLTVSYERFWIWTDYAFRSNVQNTKTNDYNNQAYYSMNAFYELGFYPNNRTLLNTSVSLATNYSNKNTWIINPQFLFSTSYFLGYRTRLNAAISYAFNRSSFEQAGQAPFISSQSSANFSVGLTHILF